MIHIAAPNARQYARLLRAGVLLLLAVGVAFPLASALAMPLVAPAEPQSQVTVTAMADATVDRASPSANFGADVRLKALVDEHLTVTQRALLRFDLPADVLIDAARLELKLNQSGGPASVTLRAYQVAGPWSEMAVTWNSRPALGSHYADAAVGVGTGWVAWDVTAIGRAWQTEPNYGLLLDIAPSSQTAYAYRAFLSRQGEAPPRLVVTYHRPNYTLHAPANGGPGAELPVAGESFIPGAAVTLQLAQGASLWPCGSVTPDTAGTFRDRCAVPMAALPGAAVLRARSAGGGLLVETAVQIEAGPGLQLVPTSGPPGTVVNYTVTDLVAGSLRLDYAGVPLVGPLPTSGGSATGTFVVPGDRPSPLGAATTVKAINLVGGLPVGSMEAAFGSQSPSPLPDVAFASLSTPEGRIIPGETFTVTGQVAAAGTDLRDYQVTALWRDSAGRSLPLGQPAAVGADGRFQLPARAPGLLTGDAWSSRGGDDVLLLTVRKPGREAVREQSVQFHGPYTPTLDVEVVNSDNEQPVEGARVWLRSHEQLAPGAASGTTQVSYFQWANETWQQNTWQEGFRQVFCTGWWDQVTTPAGETHFDLPALKAPAVNPWDEALASSASLARPTVAGAAVWPFAIEAPPPPNPPTGPEWEAYGVVVDALLAGFGLPDATGGWRIYTKDVYFDTRTGELQDAWQNDLGNPLVVMLDPIPFDQIPFDFKPVMVTDGVMEPGDPLTWGGFLSFAGLAGPGVTLPAESGAGRVGFGLGEGQYDALDNARLWIDGQDQGTLLCERGGFSGGPGVPSCDTTGSEVVYKGGGCTKNFTIGSDWSPGYHEVKVTAKLQVGAEFTKTLRIHMADAPAWFRLSTAARRTAERDGNGYTLMEDVIEEPRTVTSSSTAADTPQTGAVVNTATLEKFKHTGFVSMTGASRHSTEYAIDDMKVLNNVAPRREETVWGDWTTAAEAHSAESAAVGQQSLSGPASGIEIPISYSGPLFNTGNIDLGQVSLDLFGVVQVAVGAERGAKADLSVNGSIVVDAPPRIDLAMRPMAQTWGAVWVQATLLEIVARVKATIGYAFATALTLTLKDYEPGIDDPCFQYRGYTKVEAGLVCIGSWCFISDSKTYPWPAVDLPPRCQIPPATTLAAIAGEETPPQVDAALASDGFGHTVALWPGDKTALTAILHDGAAWSSPITIPTGTGPAEPAVAFFAPNRALAAWAESSIPANTVQPPITASRAYAEVVQSYSIAYSIWDGGHWSAAQHLTLPTTPGTGEGKVSLAACPATTAGCPAGGAVTAVWVRDVAGAPARRQYRLYFATYQGGAWSVPQPVDPASTATDSQPAAAYRLGLPVVAWVRDTDRNAATVQDRRIAWKTLDGISGVSVPEELPGGIVELALAVDSAGVRQLAFTRAEDAGVGVVDTRHPLYRAYATCTRTCWWTYHKLLDSRGRALHAEAPVLTIDRLDRPTITYRALGFGPDPTASPFAYPEDTAGVTGRTGELAQVELSKAPAALAAGELTDESSLATGPIPPTTLRVAPSYLTADGAVNWEPLAAYDGLRDSTIGLAVRGPLPAEAASVAAQVPRASVATELGLDQPLIGANVARQPNLVVVTATVSSRYPVPAEPLSLTVALCNDGADFNTPLGPLVDLVATWDGGPGLGAAGYSDTIAAPHAGQVVTYTVALAAPPPLSAGAPAARYAAQHTLTVAVNPTQTLPEHSGTDNSVTLLVGGLPAPTALTAALGDSALVVLQWTAPAAGHTAGYRVYRAVDGEPSLPVGSSFVPGWVDLAARPGHTYRYWVTSYAADGLEGMSSAAATVRTPQDLSRLFVPLLLGSAR